MDLILVTIAKLKQLVDKLKNLFSFVEMNYLPENPEKVESGLFDFFDIF